MPSIVEELFSVSGKTAVVTGGATGIGAMISTALVRAGVDVTIVSRSAKEGEAFAAKLSKEGSCSFLAYDLSTVKGIKEAAASIAARTPELNILVNNAGLFNAGPIADVTEEQWDREVDVNLRAPFFLTQALLPQLKAAKREGDPARVINIGSIAALWGKSVSAYSYVSAKAGVHQLTRALASDLTTEGINVNAIAPGFFPSALTDGFFSAAPGLKEQIIQSIPARRLGSPSDIGGAVIFLSSRAGTYLAGAVLPVEGGMWAAS